MIRTTGATPLLFLLAFPGACTPGGSATPPPVEGGAVPPATSPPPTAPPPATAPSPSPAPAPSLTPARSCGMSPSDWCPSPAGDPCGAHKDAAACKADARCYGMPYRGESVVACRYDARGFASNCPTVGCVTASAAPVTPTAPIR